jgi:hypothetical protein
MLLSPAEIVWVCDQDISSPRFQKNNEPLVHCVGNFSPAFQYSARLSGYCPSNGAKSCFSVLLEIVLVAADFNLKASLCIEK